MDLLVFIGIFPVSISSFLQESAHVMLDSSTYISALVGG